MNKTNAFYDILLESCIFIHTSSYILIRLSESTMNIQASVRM
ncbi:hypothetical protein [Vibrio nigripulchritudo]|nr:hypothetical protein [Vibrio nigripulchritudo]